VINIENKNKNKNQEQLLLDLENKIKEKDKIIWRSMWVLTIISVIYLFFGILIVDFFMPEGVWQVVAALGVCVVFFILCFYILKLEVSVGTYKCKNCNHETVPSYSEAFWSIHIGTTRYLKCPKCNKKSWHKKILHK